MTKNERPPTVRTVLRTDTTGRILAQPGKIGRA